MKRYLLSILLCLFIVAGLGTYYVHNAADRLPGYKLTTVKGDAKEAANLELTGSYRGRVSAEMLTVTADGSDYVSSHSLYQTKITDARWLYSNSDVNQMVKEHRNFMRGKGNENSFYKDEDWLIYAEAATNQNPGKAQSDIVVSVNLLNLASGNVKKITTTASNYDWIQIMDVQRIDNQVHILTQNIKSVLAAGDSTTDYHDYTLDINSGKLIHDDKLSIEPSGKKGVETYVHYVTGDTYSEPADFTILSVQDVQASVNGGPASIISDQLFSYQYKTGKLSELPASFIQQIPSASRGTSLDGNIVSCLMVKPDTVKIARFNLVTGQEEKGISEISAKQLGGDSIQTIFIKKGRVYILLHKQEISSVVVINWTDGALLYQGQVTSEGGKSDAAEQLKALNFDNLKMQS